MLTLLVGQFYGGALLALSPVLLDPRAAAAGDFSAAALVASGSALFAGWGVGSAVLSALADRVGRKPVAVGSAGASALFALLSARATRARALVAARAACGVGLGGMSGMGFALLVESVSGDAARNRASTGVNVAYVAAALALAALHRAVEATLSWRAELTILAAYVGAVAALVQRVAVESPAFLVGARRGRDARAAAARIARFNGVELAVDDDAADALVAAADDGAGAAARRDEGACALFARRETRATALALGGLFFSVECAYFGLALASGRLPGLARATSATAGFAVVVLLDLPGYALASALTARPRIGPTRCALACFALGGACLSLLAALAPPASAARARRRGRRARRARARARGQGVQRGRLPGDLPAAGRALRRARARRRLRLVHGVRAPRRRARAAGRGAVAAAGRGRPVRSADARERGHVRLAARRAGAATVAVDVEYF